MSAAKTSNHHPTPSSRRAAGLRACVRRVASSVQSEQKGPLAPSHFQKHWGFDARDGQTAEFRYLGRSSETSNHHRTPSSRRAPGLRACVRHVASSVQSEQKGPLAPSRAKPLCFLMPGMSGFTSAGRSGSSFAFYRVIEPASCRFWAPEMSQHRLVLAPGMDCCCLGGSLKN